MQNNRPIAQKFAMIGFVAWCVWLVIRLGIFIIQLPALKTSVLDWALPLNSILIIACGCVLTWMLARRPTMYLLIPLVILSVFQIWKVYVSEIFFSMLPQFGGYTLQKAVSVWWTNHTASPQRFALWLLPMVLLGASLIFYPIYCATYNPTAARTE